MTLAETTRSTMQACGVSADLAVSGGMDVVSPVSGEVVATLAVHDVAATHAAIDQARAAFKAWRMVPAPRRGELVRLFAEELRKSKEDLGRMVSIEAGKSPSEGLGEVQEMIDICDFAVGLSRQLYGLTIATERPGHRMMETWHPLGVVGIITAFNFPCAPWCWNSALALVCGDPVIWKPSEKTPLTALACQAVLDRAIARFGTDAPEGLSQVLVGGPEVGEALVDSENVALISATGSTRMGRIVGPKVAARFGKCILELGGNNAGIVCPSADMDMALRAIAFGAMGTAGQRCTTMRRLFVHDSVYDQIVPALIRAYGSVSIGNPLTSDALVGPLIDKAAFDGMGAALAEAQALGGTVHGGERHDVEGPASYYVRPALVEMPVHDGPVLRETFAPILYVMKYSDFDSVLEDHNAVGGGLSSSIFTTDLREMETFLSARGSDCGIANVNIGTSGAEIGGAFGGEKETGGGRESGSDAWRAYMRRATNTINYSRDLPLAQGVTFDI
ncbi:L-piperidine-6-carboxylate dehydrogenase [Pseudooceanicola nitratireducens]|uniref:L-piperidine-6-carboxylate dehydrogenase n=1 Tax=Pseudooceanicola nitratireducens TaxID=517719 RepID=UPI001C93AF7E|nr:aldehyde dehydrogenase family protein [Pseudooceanicola nitratireducens]MBY6155794.1 aldehyde dehydrogenase family protein [Pseudooceanicola nitratireducens]MBY6167364.1 aldehyde dehydrogenase family protein [Pseudooceanicola nitratireducens]